MFLIINHQFELKSIPSIVVQIRLILISKNQIIRFKINK